MTISCGYFCNAADEWRFNENNQPLSLHLLPSLFCEKIKNEGLNVGRPFTDLYWYDVQSAFCIVRRCCCSGTPVLWTVRKTWNSSSPVHTWYLHHLFQCFGFIDSGSGSSRAALRLNINPDAGFVKN
jgi:hypothetical protein